MEWDGQPLTPVAAARWLTAYRQVLNLRRATQGASRTRHTADAPPAIPRHIRGGRRILRSQQPLTSLITHS
eukprot:9539288-Prorocentrum_lima.AAC.1